MLLVVDTLWIPFKLAAVQSPVKQSETHGASTLGERGLQVGANASESVRVRGSGQNAIRAPSALARRAGMPGRSGAWRWPHT